MLEGTSSVVSRIYSGILPVKMYLLGWTPDELTVEHLDKVAYVAVALLGHTLEGFHQAVFARDGNAHPVSRRFV